MTKVITSAGRWWLRLIQRGWVQEHHWCTECSINNILHIIQYDAQETLLHRSCVQTPAPIAISCNPAMYSAWYKREILSCCLISLQGNQAFYIPPWKTSYTIIRDLWMMVRFIGRFLQPPGTLFWRLLGNCLPVVSVCLLSYSISATSKAWTTGWQPEYSHGYYTKDYTGYNNLKTAFLCSNTPLDISL